MKDDSRNVFSGQSKVEVNIEVRTEVTACTEVHKLKAHKIPKGWRRRMHGILPLPEELLTIFFFLLFWYPRDKKSICTNGLITSISIVHQEDLLPRKSLPTQSR